MSNSVVALREASSTEEFGGKAANLAQILRLGLPVPDGFAVSLKAFDKGDLTSGAEKDIIKFILKDKLYAVRSSATSEDSEGASWAGQFETFLNTKPEDVIAKVQECHGSIKDRARAYSELDSFDVAVVIQEMVPSEVSGVLFTVNPVTGRRDELMIEAIYGLGELIVQGTVTPESVVVSRSNGKVISSSDNQQTKKLIYQDGENIEVSLSKTEAGQKILTEGRVEKLVELATKIEDHYGTPQDIEWAIADGKIYIVQTRPITTLANVVDLPDFFKSCIKTIARPATLQRDELFRVTSNSLATVGVVTLPLGGQNRAYYLEASGSKKIAQSCLANVNDQTKLAAHIEDYVELKQQASSVCELTDKDPANYKEVWSQYQNFLANLSQFLYTGVAIDVALYPAFKEVVSEQSNPSDVQRILDVVATPKDLHDYQKLRLEICKLKLLESTDSKNIDRIVSIYEHTNEYSFVEQLIDSDFVASELSKLTKETAQVEIEEIEESIDNSVGFLEEKLSEPLLTQALLIKEYALLRTDRIDQLKKVQTKLRATFDSLAKEFTKSDGQEWAKDHIANLLNTELEDYISKGEIPSLKEVSKRLDQSYLYYYEDNRANVVTDPKFIQEAVAVVAKQQDSLEGSLISSGTTAFPGEVTGRVVRIESKDDLVKVQEGDIIIAHVTMPDYTPAMKVAAGFITAEGGVTSHAAIVARELSKPCIVGADNCMEVLSDGDYILLDSRNQLVKYAEKIGHNLGDPSELFYWGPSRANPIYMSDFMAAAEEFFTNMANDPDMPNPPKTLVLFHEGKMVWLNNAQDFVDFTEGCFNKYFSQNRFVDDSTHWRMDVARLNKAESGVHDLVHAWRYTLFAEFSLYGAEPAINKLLERFDAKTKQEIWGAFTLPSKPTFLNAIDKELHHSGDPKALADKYPWIEDGYSGVNGGAAGYFEKRLKIVKDSPQIDVSPVDRADLTKKYSLTDQEVSALDLARLLAEFMDDRKAWMMQTRSYIKNSAGLIEDGWFFSGEGNIQLLGRTETEELWERYIDFKTSTMAVSGVVASNGGKHFVNGEVRVIMGPTDNVEDDMILVVPATSPSYVPLMRKARALITDHGGMMSHAAIVGREFNLPCIVGTKQATKILKDGDKVVLDLVKGEVIK